MRMVVPSLPSVRGATNVVVITAHEEMFPVEERWRETSWLINRGWNLDLRGLISANVQTLSTTQWQAPFMFVELLPGIFIKLFVLIRGTTELIPIRAKKYRFIPYKTARFPAEISAYPSELLPGWCLFKGVSLSTSVAWFLLCML